jgi:hypothetical protein
MAQENHHHKERPMQSRQWSNLITPLLATMALIACNADRTAGPIAATERTLVSANAYGAGGSGGKGGGGGDEGFGNNLSVPVIFAEARGLAGANVLVGGGKDYTATGFRPVAGLDDGALAALLAGNQLPFFYEGNVAETYTPFDAFWQKSANVWQAEWDARLGPPTPAIVDWGDNFRSVSYSSTSVIRVEHTLYANDGTIMQGYPHDVTINPSSSSELQAIFDDGQQTVTVPMTPTVFSDRARLRIDKLSGPGGTVTHTLLDKAVYESFGIDGPGGYGAELNVGGKVVFGYVWDMKKVVMPPGVSKEGWWRITFSLDAGAGVTLDGVALGDELLATYSPTVTSAEIEILSRRGGGKKP